MSEQKIKEIIAQLKEIRKVRGLTYQRIFEMVEESGGNGSLATIKRVFADRSEERSFRYEDSLRPIVIALIGKDPVEPQEGETMSIAEQEANALRTVAALKEDMIAELREENRQLTESYEKKLEYIKEESAQKSLLITTLTQQINRKDKAIFWLVLAVIALSVLIIAALIIDRINPHLGYFWRNVGAILSGGEVSGTGMIDGGGSLLLAGMLWRLGR